MLLCLSVAFLYPLTSGSSEVEHPQSLVAWHQNLAHRDDLDDKTKRRLFRILSTPKDFSEPQPFETLQGGAATVRGDGNRNAFSKPSANLRGSALADFAVGNGIFKKLWTPSPSSTLASDGLGPVFNARACQRCHLKDGRGHPPTQGKYWENGDDAVSFVVGLSLPKESTERLPIGRQLHDFAAPGLKREGRVVVHYTPKTVRYADGHQVTLRVPNYRVSGSHSVLSNQTVLQPRVANQVIGLGLLEAVHAGDILKRADPDDHNGDSVSGRANWTLDRSTGSKVLGRFGWTANQPNLRQQSAAAFSTDMGLSTSLFSDPWGDCALTQVKCRALPHGQGRFSSKTSLEPEVPDVLLDLVTFYVGNLGVPRRRNADDPTVLLGKRVFHETGCASCHTPNYLTRDDETVRAEHRRQLIWPYTDLLLHDMGLDLADKQIDGTAANREWRTPPLWGIGLTKQVSGHTQFLHDGRARSLEEAILWHGGEGEFAQQRFLRLPRAERAALIAFLESL